MSYGYSWNAKHRPVLWHNVRKQVKRIVSDNKLKQQQQRYDSNADADHSVAINVKQRLEAIALVLQAALHPSQCALVSRRPAKRIDGRTDG